MAVVGAKQPKPSVSKKFVPQPTPRSAARSSRSRPRPRSRPHQRAMYHTVMAAKTARSTWTQWDSGIARVNQSPPRRANPRIGTGRGRLMTQGTHHATYDPRNFEILIYVIGALWPR